MSKIEVKGQRSSNIWQPLKTKRGGGGASIGPCLPTCSDVVNLINKHISIIVEETNIGSIIQLGFSTYRPGFKGCTHCATKAIAAKATSLYRDCNHRYFHSIKFTVASHSGFPPLG